MFRPTRQGEWIDLRNLVRKNAAVSEGKVTGEYGAASGESFVASSGLSILRTNADPQAGNPMPCSLDQTHHQKRTKFLAVHTQVSRLRFAENDRKNRVGERRGGCSMSS